MSVEGLRVFQSKHGPAETVDRLEAAVKRHGLALFARIDHAAHAREAGTDLRPTVVVMFGSARAGAPTVRAAQTLGIDLPLKMLVWLDEKDVTWVAYNDPAWLLRRHGIADDGMSDVMNDVLANIAGAAIGR